MADQPEPTSPPSANQQSNMNLAAGGDITTGGDVVGRDKITINVSTPGAPVKYATRDDYLAQIIGRHQDLEFVGIPELKDRQALRIEDVFIHLRVDSPTRRAEVSELLIEHLMKLPPREVRTLQLRYGLLDGKIYSVEDIAGMFGFSSEEIGEIERKSLGVIGPQAKQLLASARISANEALKTNQFLVILGDPGTGKTTLLKYITVAFAQTESGKLGLNEDRLPIFVRLYDYVAKKAERREDYSLIRYLYTQAEENLSLKLESGFFESELERGNCCVCLDGLDELGGAGLRREVTNAVAALANRYPRNRFIVTSRIVGYEEAPLDRREFAHHTVLPLTDDDIREFVKKWYAAREKDPVSSRQRAEHLTKTIMDEPRIKSLAANPLMLTIIALVHRIEAELPHERVKLYDKCVTALVETWEKIKGLTIEDQERPYYKYRRRLLEQLAFWMHSQPDDPSTGSGGSAREVKEGDLELRLTCFLLENPKLQLDEEGARQEAQAFIALARSRTGLLVERGEGIYSFAHLTFQEYLAAADIEHRLAHSIDAIWGEIQPHLHDPHWREMILLLLGSLNKFERHPTELVRRIYESADEYKDILHRHLFLAARALADRVEVDVALYQKIVDALLEIARSNALARLDAWESLDSLQPDYDTAKSLLALAHDSTADAETRVFAAYTAGHLGNIEEATTFLLTLARDEQADSEMRSDAAQALGELGCADDAAQILLALARDKKVSGRVRRDAAQALGQLGRTDNAASSLLTLARDKDVDAGERSAALQALGQLGRAADAVSLLFALARDKEVADWVRRDAAQALGQLGRADDAILSDLLALARDQAMSAGTWRDIALALGQLGRTDDASQILLALARDSAVSADVRRAAAQALGQLGRADDASQILLALARDSAVSADVRRATAQALGQLGRAADASQILLILARDQAMTPEVRSAAAQDLGQLGHADDAIPILLALARNQAMSAGTWRDIALALGQLGRTDDAIDILFALARSDIDDLGRRDAAEALGRLGHADEAASLLLSLARDKEVDDWARSAAYQSLKALLGG